MAALGSPRRPQGRPGPDTLLGSMTERCLGTLSKSSRTWSMSDDFLIGTLLAIPSGSPGGIMNIIYIQFKLSGEHVAAFERVKAARYIASTTEMARSLLLSALAQADAEGQGTAPVTVSQPVALATQEPA